MTRLSPACRVVAVTLATLAAIPVLATSLPVEQRLPAPKELRLPADWQPLRYAVHLTIDPAVDSFQGDVVIDIRVLRPTDVLWLHAEELELDSVRVTAGRMELGVLPAMHGKDYLALQLGRTLAVGPAQIAIRYRGRLDGTDTHGLFRQQEGGRWYAFSQFEAIAARRAVPCFDEPNHKVPWQLTLTVPADDVALSNTREVSSVPAARGMKTVMFAETKPLPSYLVALAIGPFDIVDVGKVGSTGIPLRIVTPKGLADQAGYAASITPELFNRVEAYFGIPYPYDKLDEVAIPQTVSFGAMENPGLITYSQTGLLSRTDDLTIGQKRRLANTTAHEIAHQWFGNLVTMEFWDDIWLNEGFATWLAAKIVDEWMPQWDGAVSNVQRRSRVMGADSLVTARKIQQPIIEPGDIDNAFDGITYSKGSATLAMFERWLGVDPFRAGIRRYISKHSWGNATSDDLLDALAAASTPATAKSFATFLTQPGLPLISIQLNCGSTGEPTRLKLSQKRFLPTGSTGSSDQRWQVPVCVRWSRKGAEQRACKLMTDATAVIDLDAHAGCPDWVLGNDGQMGYYRTSYGGDLLDRLLRNGGKHLTLPERVGVLGDVSALARNGELHMSQVLQLIPVFSQTDNRHLVANAASMAASVDDELVPDELRPNYARFISKMFSARAHDLGFTARATDDDDTRMLRDDLLSLVTDLGADAELRAQAAKLALAWLDDRTAVEPDMVSTVLQLAAIDGDRALFDRFHAAAKATEDRRERRRLLGAMGAFRNHEIVQHAFTILSSEEFDIREMTTLLWSPFGKSTTRPLAWAYFKENFARLKDRLPRESLPRLANVAGSFCDEPSRADAEAFLRENLADVPGATRNLEQSLESVSLCIANKNAQQSSVAEFLRTY